MIVEFLFFLMIGSIDAAKDLIRVNNALSVNNGPLFYVNGLVEDWNKKHNQIGEVVVFNIGKENYFSQNVAKIIPKDNPVTILDPSRCDLIETRKAAFIIITLDIFSAVSCFQ